MAQAQSRLTNSNNRFKVIQTTVLIMHSRRSESSQDTTRQRLLEAAGQVFADQGYRQATVRDICARADANVASINYHFGDKEKLYSAAVRYAHDCAKRYPIDAG